MSKRIYEVAHVVHFDNCYSDNKSKVTYTTHKGTQIRVELDAERTAKINALMIKIAEEQFFADTVANEIETKMAPPSAICAALEAPKSRDNMTATEASFDDEAPF